MKNNDNRPSSVEPLSLDDFATFYEALYGHPPFKWQVRLAERACRAEWPDYIKLPTSSGKTAAIDIAVFALAFQAAVANRPDGVISAARRIFFVVDRRIIVNEAYRRTERAAKLLRQAVDQNTESNNRDAARFEELDESHRNVLTRVAVWLQELAGDNLAPPLDCFELRGGIYRDDAWVRSPLQPTVLTSTVDQVGSRLLFRGYGVSDRNLSIHAALTANDSLIILDEAHCSKPFSQTMESIARYRGEHWAEQSIAAPFSFVQMTATPPAGLDHDRLFELHSSDYEKDELLEQRHGCHKPVHLGIAKGAKGKKLIPTLAKKLVEQAETLYADCGLKKIAIVVNRVALAREAFDQLRKKHKDRVSLMIGRMRPRDRDKLTLELQRDFASGWTKVESKAEEAEPKFVVATQCLEVGADLDFDGMVSQCASLDALRQRFGRLNRLGDSPNASGAVVAAEGDLQPLEKLERDKPLDPIYGNALARTWHWLQEQAETKETGSSNEATVSIVDFGIKPLDARCQSLGEDISELLAPAEDAPVLMPAHVDMLCQTAPRPMPEPDVAAYLHGPNRGSAEVRVCWRADLDLGRLTDTHRRLEQAWLSAVDICPPSSAECLTVPLRVFRKWLRGEKATDDTSDVLGEAIDSSDEDQSEGESQRTVLVWRGKRRKKRDLDNSNNSFCASGTESGRVRPNDTIVIPAEFGGWKALGYVPDAPADPTEPPSDRVARQHAEVSDEIDRVTSANDLAAIDVAGEAFLKNRARTMFRVHPKLRCDGEAAQLFDDLLAELKRQEADLGVGKWRDRVNKLLGETGTANDSQLTDGDDSLLVRLSNSKKGQIVRYHDGLAWITERHEQLTQGILPLPSFGDDSDTLSLTGKISLKQHLADVYHEATRFVTGLTLNEVLSSTVLQAARLHDVGKADPRFQAVLLNKPLSVAYMQRQLWAKSDGTGRNTISELPDNFRHEMLSLALFDRFELDEPIDQDLLMHNIASHHGHARPFAPVCIDDAPVSLNLSGLGLDNISSEQRASWRPAHQLDSGIADRFWKMNRKYGWWGLAYLESLLRLADWFASGTPGRGDDAGISLTGIPAGCNGMWDSEVALRLPPA